MDRTGERGEPKVDETDLEWEYMVATAAADAVTPWHTVRFDDSRPMKCWADDYYPTGMMHGCFEIGTTSVGLCPAHYEEMICSTT